MIKSLRSNDFRPLVHFLGNGTFLILAPIFIAILLCQSSYASSKGGLNTSPSQAATIAWQYLNSNWRRCLDDFKLDTKRFDVRKFKRLLTQEIQWHDGRDEFIRNSTIDSLVHNGDPSLVVSQLYGRDAVTFRGTLHVVVGPNFFTDNTQTEQIAITIHEALHVLTKMDDADLAGWLVNFGFKPSKLFRTAEITDWIVGAKNHMDINNGCPKD